MYSIYRNKRTISLPYKETKTSLSSNPAALQLLYNLKVDFYQKDRKVCSTINLHRGVLEIRVKGEF